MKIKLLNENAQVPTRGSNQSAGYDLYNCSGDVEISENMSKYIGTGIALEIPEGYVGLVFARSGLSCKRSLRPANCVGVIDSDYRGEIIVCLHNDSNIPQKIENNERIAQIVIVPYVNTELEVADELTETSRGSGGFGSTGTH